VNPAVLRIAGPSTQGSVWTVIFRNKADWLSFSGDNYEFATHMMATTDIFTVDV
jgi:hypothetical protein